MTTQANLLPAPDTCHRTLPKQILPASPLFTFGWSEEALRMNASLQLVQSLSNTLALLLQYL